MVDIADAVPSVKRYDSAGNLLQDVTYSSNPDGYEHIHVIGTGGQDQDNLPGANATLYAGVAATGTGARSGTYDATTVNITGNSGEYMEVVYKVYALASTDADNAAVFNWKVFLRSTLTSTGQ